MSRDSNYRRNKFNNWRSKVKKLLPNLVIKFYTSILNGKYIGYEEHKLLGSVIKDINNPYYSITNNHGELLDDIGIMSSEIMLEIQVSKLFKFVNTKL